MSVVGDQTVTLPPEQATYIDALVTAGVYGSAKDVIAAALDALRDRHTGIDAWLHEHVVPVHDAMLADRATAVPADHVLGRIMARHEAAPKS